MTRRFYRPFVILIILVLLGCFGLYSLKLSQYQHRHPVPLKHTESSEKFLSYFPFGYDVSK